MENRKERMFKDDDSLVKEIKQVMTTISNRQDEWKDKHAKELWAQLYFKMTDAIDLIGTCEGFEFNERLISVAEMMASVPKGISTNVGIQGNITSE